MPFFFDYYLEYIQIPYTDIGCVLRDSSKYLQIHLPLLPLAVC